MQIRKIHNFSYVLNKAAVFEKFHIQSNGFTVYTAGADLDYRNVRSDLRNVKIFVSEKSGKGCRKSGNIG